MRGNKARNSNKLWTKEEDEYIAENWGIVSAIKLARNLRRSLKAVQSRASGDLRLGRFFDASTENIALCKVASGLGMSYSSDKMREKYPDLPVKFKKIASNKRHFAVVEYAAMWRWLKKHKEISLAKLEPLAFGCEPAWVAPRRQADYAAMLAAPNKGRWTSTEDKRLALYVKNGLTAEDIAQRLNRTIEAVRRRVPVVTYQRLPPVKKRHRWTDAERYRLGELIGRGMTVEQVVTDMAIERDSVIAQMWTWYGTRNADRLRQKIKERGIHGAQRNGNGQAKAG